MTGWPNTTLCGLATSVWIGGGGGGGGGGVGGTAAALKSTFSDCTTGVAPPPPESWIRARSAGCATGETAKRSSCVVPLVFSDVLASCSFVVASSTEIVPEAEPAPACSVVADAVSVPHALID